MTTRAVFFDLGGTLLVMRRDRIFQRVVQENGRDASLDAIHSAYMRLEPWWLETYSSRQMSPEEAVESYRHLDERTFSSLFPDAGPGEAVRTSGLVRKRWPELAKAIPLELYPDVEPTLTSLSERGLHLGLISNATADTARTVELLGLGRYMSNIVISGAVGFAKPNAEIFRIALRAAGVEPSESVHVGDIYEADVVGARNAGMRGVLVDRKGEARGYDCPTVNDLKQILEQV